MSKDSILDQLFKFSSPKEQKKDPNDYLNSIFDMQMTLPVSSQPQKKKKKEDDVHDYIKFAEKGNQKVKKGVEKWKQERTMTPNQIAHRRKIEKITTKFQQGKIQSHSIKPSGQKKVYLPNIIDPFAKPGDKKKTQKPKVQKQPEVVIREKITKIQERPRKQIKQVVKQKERPSKVEVKQQKIIRKIQQKAQVQKKITKQVPQKKPKRASSSSSSLSSSSSQSKKKQPEQVDWRKQLRQITKYNPNAEIFQKRDRQIIKQSGIDRIFGQDRYSSRMGKLEEEEDWRKQLEAKYKKKKHSH